MIRAPRPLMPVVFVLLALTRLVAQPPAAPDFQAFSRFDFVPGEKVVVLRGQPEINRLEWVGRLRSGEGGEREQGSKESEGHRSVSPSFFSPSLRRPPSAGSSCPTD